MTPRDIVALLRRHPVVVMLAAFLTLGAFAYLRLAPRTYQAEAGVTYLSPQSSSPKADAPRNAFSNFNKDLIITAQASAITMSGDAASRQVRAAGGTGQYQALLLNGGNEQAVVHDQPYVILIATGHSPAEAQRTLEIAVRTLRSDLESRQLTVGSSVTTLITARTSPMTAQPIPITGRPSRAFGAVLVIGLIGVVALAFIFERHPSWRFSFTREARRMRAKMS